MSAVAGLPPDVYSCSAQQSFMGMSSSEDFRATPAAGIGAPAVEERSRGRRRSRNHDRVENGEVGDPLSSEEDPNADHPRRKRRRSRKGLDKKFECDHKGCGKTYSRAEHLYRHQLNHKPKEIYRCEYGDCPRWFVRQDLCARHRERHTARAPQPPRNDAAVVHGLTSQASGQPGLPQPLDLSPISGRTDLSISTVRDLSIPPADTDPSPSPFPTVDPDLPPPVKLESSNNGSYRKRDLALTPIKTEPSSMSYRSGLDRRPTSASTVTSVSTIRGGMDALSALSVTDNSPTLPLRTSDGHVNGSFVGLKRSNSDSNYRGDDRRRMFDGSTTPRSTPISALSESRRQASFGAADMVRPHFSPQSNATAKAFIRPSLQTPMTASGMPNQNFFSPYSPVPVVSQAPAGTTPIHSAAMAGTSYAAPPGSFVTQQGFVPLSLPPPGYNTLGQTAPSRSNDGSFVTSPPTTLSSAEHFQDGSGLTMQSGMTDSVPFETASYSIPVFNGGGLTRSPFAMAADYSWLFSEQANNASTMGQQMGSLGPVNFADNYGASFHPGCAVNELSMDSFFPQSIAQPQHPMAVTSILDASPAESLLSEEKRQQLIDLIELRFNETDHAPVAKQKADLLDGDRTDDDHVLSLRMLQTYIWSYWYHFHPQLPILHHPTFIADKTQTLLLVAMIAIGASCLQKEHGHRATQEGAKLANFLAWHLRGEIFNHAHFRPPAKLWVFQALLLLEVYEKMYSTRTLHENAHIHHATTITLMKRGSSLVGKSALDTPPGVKDDKATHGSNSSTRASSTGTTPDRWWHEWITSEATHRAAFAAFVIDSLHATMFGHSAVTVAHDMLLPLPYDEALWSARTSVEVGRIEAGLSADGYKRIRFLDGLKQMLNQQPVRTNSFGRTILMAGLLSVSWHMNQRDLQVSSLGVVLGRDKWKGALTRAFDFWKQDFDRSLIENPEPATGSYQYPGSKKVQDGIVFESKIVLHHLAHMAMHVDIVDCQIFARAGRLLGKIIAPQDYNSAQRRMKDWAKTARARDATFYALKFLTEVLIIENFGPHVMPTPPLTVDYPGYSAREDYLMNRPWVLYFAALVVWSYGYALEGPITPWRKPPSTPAEKQQDMVDFLQRVGGVSSPELLTTVHGRNMAVGTLMVLRDMFETTRWELLHEGSLLLSNCIQMLVGPSP